LCLWDRCSTTWAMPPAIFALIILHIVSCFLSRPDVPLFPYFSWDDMHMPPCSAFFCWYGVSQTFLSRLTWICDPLHLSSLHTL
jgi:hypothetical protein